MSAQNLQNYANLVQLYRTPNLKTYLSAFVEISRIFVGFLQDLQTNLIEERERERERDLRTICGTFLRTCRKKCLELLQVVPKFHACGAAQPWQAGRLWKRCVRIIRFTATSFHPPRSVAGRNPGLGCKKDIRST